MDTNTPERIGKYRITGVLGRGGMGNVYKAAQEPLNRQVALKLLPQEYARNEEFQSRFVAEAKAISQLEHQNIVGIYDFGTEEGVHYIAMRYIEVVNLGDRIRKEKKLGWELAVDYARQICRALRYAHERNIIHRDIKPQNILLDNQDHLFVTDFGIAKLYQETSITRTGVVVGTPEYMSPEQAEGLELNPQTDLYSLGIVLFEMITGDPPFTGENPLSVAYQHVNTPPPLLTDKVKDIPRRLELVVIKALKKDRNNRYKNADELLYDLDTVFDEGAGAGDTRDMVSLEDMEREARFAEDKRIVDRRGNDRRRGLRRSYFRRVADSRTGKEWAWLAVKVLVVLGVLGLAGFAIRRAIVLRQPIIPEGLRFDRFSGAGNPVYACDDNTATCWEAPATAAECSLRFKEPRLVNRIDVVSGNNTAPGAFVQYARPKRVRFVFNSDIEFEVELADAAGRQELTIPETINAEKVSLKVMETYPGTAIDKVCISEVRFWHSPDQ